MKHVMYGEKSLLMEDESAEALIEYAGTIARNAGGDTAELRAVGMDGNEVTVTFLLNPGTVLIVESTNADFDLPTNEEAVNDLWHRIDRMRNPPSVQAESQGRESTSDFDEMR